MDIQKGLSSDSPFLLRVIPVIGVLLDKRSLCEGHSSS
jgi:hypothetical protein